MQEVGRFWAGKWEAELRLKIQDPGARRVCAAPLSRRCRWSANVMIPLPSGPELIEAVPIIVSLIVIEGLLSVDNALAIAAMASHLPGRQKYHALKLGLV